MSVQDDITRIVWNLAVPPHTSVSIDTSSHDVERRVEPVTEHDGKLGDNNLGDDYYVKYHYNTVEIRDSQAEFVGLTAKQALSLLAWLLQEKGKLEGLAKEQAE